MFLSSDSQEDIRQQALIALTAEFVHQGHPPDYAKHMATAAIFQTDLELRNAQLFRLLSWFKQEHSELYPEVLKVVESVRQEFEQRVQQAS